MVAEYECGIVMFYRPPVLIPSLLSELYCKVDTIKLSYLS